jgi:hypothetical protein
MLGLVTHGSLSMSTEFLSLPFRARNDPKWRLRTRQALLEAR